MAIKNFGFNTVEKFLVTNKYYIPDYQREYSWDKEEQISDFWLDLLDLVENDRENHFFGQIVVHDNMEERKKYIIDGQQRSSTSVIFFAVMLRLFDELHTETGKESARNKVEDIRVSIMGRWSEEENELKFHMGKMDNEFFRDYIQRGKPITGEVMEASHIRIKNAYEFLYQKLTEQLQGLDSYQKYEKLLLIYKTFKDKFTLMYVETDDINEAFIIFETLNARGKDLETSDLLKNHLFKTSCSLIDDVKNEWLKMQANAEGIDLTKYIRTIWNSSNDFSREKELYKNLKRAVTKPSECLTFAKKLVDCLDPYKVLCDPQNESCFADKEIEKHIDNLRILSASTYYPIIIAMVNASYNEEDIKKVVQAIESFIVRNCVIAGKVANKYEMLFAKVAKKISKDKLSYEEILAELKPEMLNDDDFENYFEVSIIKSAPVAKFILRRIADHQQREMLVNPSNMVIHLEHIMPKKVGKWKISEELHQKYLHRIGNLTLLADEYNTSIKNKVYSDKKETYKKSKIEMTKSLSNYTEWTVSRIEERQKDLFTIAKDVWKNF
ncbi:DUF262 domain-containing HNH endonuclease family protein [Bacillus cereus]|nr:MULTISPECIES: DUF262 domain-containing protein [Bacillus cereus group]ARX68945.1 hypothetical protein BVH75_24015 [Bacillus thuringiensis]MCC2493762.1 DUF262 domain-containing HNH endonuclease family protein [Bacillus cereus]MDZ4592270.1 DUF262 domain-containing HNH endonuclease family protein [Bacillus cereus]MEB9693360.1 DUF262 domain-containing HNH endonuclease family protein [Bacillus cereus]HDR6286377.1 DUF262 domain-containing protein [Bacillus cereus]